MSPVSLTFLDVHIIIMIDLNDFYVSFLRCNFNFPPHFVNLKTLEEIPCESIEEELLEADAVDAEEEVRVLAICESDTLLLFL